MASGDHHHHHHHHEHDHAYHDHDQSHGGSVTNSWVGPDGKAYHSHDGLAPHSHEPIYSPGYFTRRAPPLLTRDFTERAFTVGIGGPVGTGYLLFFILLYPLHCSCFFSCFFENAQRHSLWVSVKLVFFYFYFCFYFLFFL